MIAFDRFGWCTLKRSALPLSKDVSSTVFSHLTLRKKFLFLKSLINSWCFRKSPSSCLKQNYEQFLNSVIFTSIRSQGPSSDLSLAYFSPIGVKYRVSTLPALCANAMLLLECDGDVNAHSSSFPIKLQRCHFINYRWEKIAELHSLRKFRFFFFFSFSDIWC